MLDTARTTTTNQPTNRAQNKPSGPVCAQESIFWGKNGRSWAKHPNYFDQKIWYTHISVLNEAPRSHCFIGRAWHQMDNKGQYLAQNDQICIFWTKFGRFWAKNPNFYGSK